MDVFGWDGIQYPVKMCVFAQIGGEAMRNTIKIKLAAACCVIGLFLFCAVDMASAAGALTIAVSSSTVKAGDTVTVTVYAAGADNAEVTADMNITYDASKLEYVSSSASNASGGGGTVKASGSDVSIKFKALASGDAYVKAEGATLTAAGTHIMVSGSATSSGDDSDREEEGASTSKSGDNSLSSLTISKGSLSPAFKGSVTEYTAQVGSDVSEITVTPVTSNSRATIVSITGNKDLKEGKNVITVLVRAENGTEASYRITVTKGQTSSDTSGSAGVSNMPGTAVDQVSGEVGGDDASESPDAQEPSDVQNENADGSISIDGVTYKISEDFTDDKIPEGFSRADFAYKGAPYPGIMYDYGHLGMFYLISDAGEGRFFVYDVDRDRFYPYVRLQNGEHYIILMAVPNGVIPPEHYEEKTLTMEDGINLPAYQYIGGEDEEIVKTEEGEETTGVASRLDFYLFYAMDETGAPCWYQYDVKQKTYQRYNVAAAAVSDTPEDYEALAKSYRELNERQKETKIKDRRLIAALIFVSVVLLILMINLFLKVRELKLGESEEEDEAKTARARRPVRRSRPVKRAAAAKPVRKAPRPVKNHPVVHEEEGGAFYENDDADFMDEFEEDPGVLSRKPRKKEKQAKPVRPDPVILEDDDDIEFFDL